MAMMQCINEGIKAAIRSKDALRLNVLRMLKSKVMVVDARGELSDAEIIKIFKTYFGSLQEALEHAQMAKRNDAIEQLIKEIAVVSEFLPRAPTEEQTREIVQIAIKETGAKNKKDLGLVMKAAMRLAEHLDGKLVKQVAESILES